MLYECDGYIARCGPVPEAWVGLCGRPDGEYFWLRGLVPCNWTSAPRVQAEEIVRIGYFLILLPLKGKRFSLLPVALSQRILGLGSTGGGATN